MTLSRTSRGALRERLALGQPYADRPHLAGLVAIARLAITRWRVAPRRELLRYLREQVTACGWDAAEHRQAVHGAVDLLVARMEVQPVEIDGQPHLVAGLPRVVTVGGSAFRVGCFDREPPMDASALPEDPDAVPLRWVVPSPGGGQELVADAEEIDLEDWAGEPGVAVHLRRRRATGSSAATLWEEVVRSFERADPVGGDQGYRVLCGAPGEYSGTAEGRDGRWRAPSNAPDGRWCGARLGYGDVPTAPMLVEVRGGRAVRAMDLFDVDERDWLVFGRGASEGAPERLDLEGPTIRHSVRLPRQVQELLRAMATERKGWSWGFGAPSVAQEVHGLLSRWLND